MPPSIEPVSLAEIKPYLRLDDITDATEDIYISSLITVAREYCETKQNRAYITQTWELALPCFPRFSSNAIDTGVKARVIEIPKGKLQSIDNFSYKNASGIITILTQEVDYVVSNKGILGRISPPFGKVFPIVILYPLDPIIIKFTCGYGNNPTDVPARVRHSIMLLVSHWYENRIVINDLRGVIPEEIPFAVTSLLAQDKISNV
jgi:uncharacterized phiE125 gp8 family phage protein